jgi:dynein heavy chain
MVSIQKSGVPYKEDIDPLTELADGAKMAEWANQDLPDDRFSKENAAIIDQAARWPLIIDPQLQAAK